MEGINYLISSIRDSKLLEISIQYGIDKSNLELLLTNNGKHFKIKLLEVSEVNIFDDSIDIYAKTQIKPNEKLCCLPNVEKFFYYVFIFTLKFI